MKINTDKIVRSFEDNPPLFMGMSAAVLTAVAKIIQAVGDSRGSHAYARDVNRRVKASKRQR